MHTSEQTTPGAVVLGLEVDAPFEKGIAPALLMEKYIYIYTQ